MPRPVLKTNRVIRSPQVLDAFITFLRPRLPLELEHTRITADEYQIAHEALSGKADALKDDVGKIQQLQALYDLTDKFPVWPFDTQTLTRFLAALTSPFIPIVVGLIADFVRGLLKQ